MDKFDNGSVNFSGGGGNYNNYNMGNNNDNYSDDVVSIGAWVGILILTAIPFVNIIAVLVMAFGVSNKNIRNYGKASLIIVAIPLTLAILLRMCS